jgi:hypothetical protein
MINFGGWESPWDFMCRNMIKPPVLQTFSDLVIAKINDLESSTATKVRLPRQGGDGNLNRWSFFRLSSQQIEFRFQKIWILSGPQVEGL